jgi:hypothetical protein
MFGVGALLLLQWATAAVLLGVAVTGSIALVLLRDPLPPASGSPPPDETASPPGKRETAVTSLFSDEKK